MTIWQWLGVILMFVAVPVFIVVSILFELEPIKSDAFGAYQTKTMPWLLMLCTGLGLYLNNIGIAAMVLLASLFLAGPLVHRIASFFNKST